MSMKHEANFGEAFGCVKSGLWGALKAFWEPPGFEKADEGARNAAAQRNALSGLEVVQGSLSGPEVRSVSGPLSCR